MSAPRHAPEPPVDKAALLEGTSPPAPRRPPEPLAKTLLALAAALALPGAGHFVLGRRVRAGLFLVLVLVSLSVGLYLEGKLFAPVPGQPLSYLGTFGAMGMGLLYFILRFVTGYEGTVEGAGYEYGTAFLITAGLMNLLLLLDVWDLAAGGKE